jgi:predicted RNA-binding protein YlqC (UPF0109 family)
VSDPAEVCRYIAEHIVKDPKAVAVTTDQRGRTTVVELSVAEPDVGRIIGRGGRNIDAIRALVRASGQRDQRRVHVELVDDA